MTNKLIALFLLTGNIAFAQSKTAATRFDEFVNTRKITWAAYASDTINFTRVNFNNLLLSRLGKKEIKASLPIEIRAGVANQIIYTILDSIDKAFYGDNADIMMNSEGNEVSVKRAIPKKDSSNFKVTEVTQILYIENGKLKSYVPFVTSALPVFMSTGNYIGERFYFTSCFNYRYKDKPRNTNKLIFLKQTKKLINIQTPQRTEQLKEMYGKNLLEAIWPSVLKNEIEVFSIDRNIKLKPEELNSELVYDQPKIVPIYDSTSGSVVLKYNVVFEPINPGQFTLVQLIQDWYYDQRKNKVYSNTREMILYLTKFNKTEQKDPEPVLRLIFKQ
jgi:hypothetical protein